LPVVSRKSIAVIIPIPINPLIQILGSQFAPSFHTPNSQKPIARVTEFSIAEEGGSIQVKLKLDGQYWPAPTTLAAADKELASLTNDEEKLYQRLRAVVAVMTETESASAAAEVPVGNVDLIR